MFPFLYDALFYYPVYNMLIAATAVIPTHDVGLAIVAVTILIRVITFPLMHRSVVMQRKMRELEPRLQEIRTKHKANAQEQGVQTMALYKEHGVNPFSSFGAILIQFPIIIALYQVVSKIAITPAWLYVFTPVPLVLNTMFLGFVDITERSIVLAILAGVFQFFQAKYAMPDLPKLKEGDERSFAGDFSRSLQTQTKYFLPIFIVFIGWTLPAAISLYYAANSGIGLLHELYVKRQAEKVTAIE
ncbi:MAG: hypothetical protein A2542_00845 [Parcubacteria group bacterium RIFOXYD2_FULL_52_8]|nr:MAG: hypothetical protein A2542_00845 [Parcubacteria group bacterium RIFOXYD2_FULL_52_8]